MNYIELAKIAVGKDEYRPIEKIDLWVQYWLDRSCQKTVENLVLIYEPMIPIILHKYRLIQDSDFADCVQLGRIGLFKTVLRFNPERKLLFYTYACSKVLGEVKRFFRDNYNIIHLPAWFQEKKAELERGQMSEEQFGKFMPETQKAFQNELSVFSYDDFSISEDMDGLARQIAGSCNVEEEVMGKILLEEIYLQFNREDSEILLGALDQCLITEIAKNLNLSDDYIGRRLTKIRQKIRLVLAKSDIIV